MMLVKVNKVAHGCLEVPLLAYRARRPIDDAAVGRIARAGLFDQLVGTGCARDVLQRVLIVVLLQIVAIVDCALVDGIIHRLINWPSRAFDHVGAPLALAGEFCRGDELAIELICRSEIRAVIKVRVSREE